MLCIAELGLHGERTLAKSAGSAAQPDRIRLAVHVIALAMEVLSRRCR